MTQYSGLAPRLAGAPQAVVAVGLIAVLAGLLFKVGAVPLHFWVPAVVQGATTPAVAFVATRAFAVVAELPGARTVADYRGAARRRPWLVVCLVA